MMADTIGFEIWSIIVEHFTIGVEASGDEASIVEDELDVDIFGGFNDGTLPHKDRQAARL